MPYRKRSTRKPRRRRKSGKRKTYKKGYNRTSGFYQKKGGGAELKFFDRSIGAIQVPTGGQVRSFLGDPGIPQGTLANGRVGRKIVLRRIALRSSFVILGTSTITNSADTVRIMIVLDTQANGTTLNLGELLVPQTIMGFQSLDNRQRFRILMDRTINIEATTSDGTTTNDPHRYFRFSHACNIPIEYSVGTTGDITQITSNNLQLVMFSRGGFITGQHQMRVRFSDS